MLEAICFQSREVLDAMRKDVEGELKVLRVDGGCCKNDLLMQLQVGVHLSRGVRFLVLRIFCPRFVLL